MQEEIKITGILLRTNQAYDGLIISSTRRYTYKMSFLFLFLLEGKFTTKLQYLVIVIRFNM